MAKIYHVQTQADYDALMVELEAEGYMWMGGGSLMKYKFWERYGDKTCIDVNDSKSLGFADKEYYVERKREIIEYTATNNVTNLTAHEKITAELFDTYKRKNHDYGDSFTDSLDEFGLVAGLVRVGDKLNRLKTLVWTEQQVSDESLRDTILDASNYLIMMAMWLDSEAENEKTQKETREMLGL